MFKYSSDIGSTFLFFFFLHKFVCDSYFLKVSAKTMKLNIFD